MLATEGLFDNVGSIFITEVLIQLQVTPNASATIGRSITAFAIKAEPAIRKLMAF
jgi:hypothetical protein